MKPLRSIGALFAAAVTLTWNLGAAHAGDDAKGEACWAASAEQELASCPGNGPKTLNSGQRGTQPHVRFNQPKSVETKKADDKTKPGGPTEEMQSFAERDQRQARATKKARALLITEITGLDSLFKNTPRRAPDRVSIARRLAEAYVELESAARRDKTQAEVAKNKAEADKANAVLRLARTNAIKNYELIRKEHATYKDIDEVLYYLAYEYEQGEDLENARKVYFDLIAKAPNSKYIPSAYLAFGELFFSQAQTDPEKFELAKGAYLKVIESPPPENKMWGYAHYKLAYVAWNQGNYAESLTHFRSTIDFGTKYANLPNATPLARAARRDIIPVYALSGRADKAYDFFKPLSGDKPNEDTLTFEMLDSLGQNYLDTGHYQPAIDLYTDLMRRDKGDKQCLYHSHIAEATLADKGGKKELIKPVLNSQVTVFREFKAGSHAAEAKQQCGNATASLVAETAMAWHLEAVGSGGVRGTNDTATMSAADFLYGQIVDNFTQDDFAKFEFPRIAKEDWPNLFKIKYHRADLLYAQKKWADCGPAFDAVVAENPTGPEAPEAAFAAVLCYQNIYDEQHKNGADRKGAGLMPGQESKNKKSTPQSEAEKYKPKPFDDRQKGMINAFNRYVCYIKPADTDKEGKDQYVEVKYARARTYFEAQHWEEAAVAFRDVAINHAEHEAGIFAAQLYLESLNVLGGKTDPPRPRCFDQMSDDVPKLIGLYCQGAKAKTNEEQCTQLTKIQCDIDRLRAENTVKLADRGGPNALRTYEEAANSYIALWRKYGEEPLRNKQPMQCERMDEVVYNGCRAFQAGRLIAKAITCRQILLNPENQFDKSPLARKAVYEIGGNYQAIAVYDKAADWYERFARENPKEEKADVALSDSVVLRLGLGQDQKAIDDAKLFKQNFGGRFPVQYAQIAFAIGAHYVEQANWEEARSQLAGSMATLDKSATYDVQVQAHAMLARVFQELNRGANAEQEYRKVADLWRDPDKAIAEINKIQEDEGSKIRRLGKALTAVGEAYFYFAEQKRVRTVDPIKFPEYKESGFKPSLKKMENMNADEFEVEMAARRKESEAVKKHVDTKVKEWVDKKMKAIEAADIEYQKIFSLKPQPPPRWVISAGAAAGKMWAEFVRDFRRAPIPEWMKKDDELRGVYYQNLDAASESIKQRAKSAFVTCLSLSVKHQYFDKYSRECEVWLSDNYKAEFHKVDEFRGAPNQVGSGLNDKPYPVSIGGEPHIVAPAQAPEPPKEEKKEDGKPATPPAATKPQTGGTK